MDRSLQVAETEALSFDSLKYLVVGTGRCGTVYMAKLLSSIGFPCGHEAIFTYEGIGEAERRLRGETPVRISLISHLATAGEGPWLPKGNSALVADSSYMAAPFLGHPLLENTTIIHLVRDPLKVINSFVVGLRYFRDSCLHEKYYDVYHRFIYRHVPDLTLPLAPEARAALYYLRWNEMIEKLARRHRYFFCRVEKDVPKLFRFLGVSPEKWYENKKSNHLPADQIYRSPDDIRSPPEFPDLAEQISRICQRYYRTVRFLG